MVRRFHYAAAFALVAALVLSGLPKAALAAENAPVKLALQGKPLATSGELVNGTTFVPVKALGVELGFKVMAYDPARVIVAGLNNRIIFSNGNGLATVSGHETYCSVPFLENGQLMVPARFLLENMGYRLTWSNTPSCSIDLVPVQLNHLVIGTVRERQETSTLVTDVQYPKLSGLESKEVQDAMNAYFASRPNAALQQAYQNEKDMIAGGITQFAATEAALNYTVEYNQNGFLSLLFEDYLYLGGAHGMTTRAGYLADVKTGKTYSTLKDLFKDGTDYVSLISPEVKKQFDAMGEGIALTPFEQTRPDQGFYIKDNDLVIYFDLYEHTPYAAGFPEFHIPLASLSNVLVPELAPLAK